MLCGVSFVHFVLFYLLFFLYFLLLVRTSVTLSSGFDCSPSLIKHTHSLRKEICARSLVSAFFRFRFIYSVFPHRSLPFCRMNHREWLGPVLLTCHRRLHRSILYTFHLMFNWSGTIDAVGASTNERSNWFSHRDHPHYPHRHQKMISKFRWSGMPIGPLSTFSSRVVLIR